MIVCTSFKYVKSPGLIASAHFFFSSYVYPQIFHNMILSILFVIILLSSYQL
jgi:hypothetical protein